MTRHVASSGPLAAIALHPAGAPRAALYAAPTALVRAMAMIAVAAMAIALPPPARAIAQPASGPPVATRSAPPAGDMDRGEDVLAREAWFYGQRAFPRASIPSRAYLRARKHATKLPRFPGRRPDKGAGSPDAPRQGGTKSFVWTSIGPRPIASKAPLFDAGRVTALAVQNAKTVYAGAANGGVWKTTTGGLHWTAVFDDQPSLAIGAITIDPNDSKRIFAGTGEGNFSIDSYSGAGLFRSSDAGTSWSKIDGSRFDSCSISDIVVKPGDSSTLGVAVVASGVPGPTGCDPSRQGVHVSTDGGKTWALKAPIPGGIFKATGAFDMAISSTNPAIWFAGMANGSVWRSTDSGQTWSPALIVPNGARTNIAVAPSKLNLIIAAVEIPAHSTVEETVDLYLSSDRGTTWNNTELPVSRRVAKRLCAQSREQPRQCWYDLALTFDPANPRVFYLGAVPLYRYERLVGGGWAVGQVARDTHVDVHALAHDPTGNLWIASDGGVNTLRWVPPSTQIIRGKSEHLPISEFEPGVSGDLNQLIGGTQDNGTLRYTGALRWDSILGGDGGFSASDPTARATIFATQQNFLFRRSTDGGTTWKPITPIHGSDRGLFYSPLVNEPGSPRTLYAGSHRLWRSTNRGDSWRGASQGFPNAISAIGTGTSTPTSMNTTAYVGFGRLPGGAGPGGVAFSANVTSTVPTWTAGSLPPLSPGGSPRPFPNRSVTDFWVNPLDPKEAYTAVSGFGTDHVFHTTDGVNWVRADGNALHRLPDTPVNAMTVDTSGAFPIIYAGTDVGVFASGDRGENWVNASTNLPPSAVVDLLIDTSQGKLIAATHGRGAYTAQLSQAPPFADITTPKASTDPVVARFNVPVEGVTTSNFVLRAEGTAIDLPASIVCKSSTGSSVNCATEKVSVAELTSPLTPGHKYVAVVNPFGPLQIKDGTGTPVPTTFRGFEASA